MGISEPGHDRWGTKRQGERERGKGTNDWYWQTNMYNFSAKRERNPDRVSATGG